MRIRRYAAACSPPRPPPRPPQPPAPWLHAADDDCAFCDLTRGSDPQVAPDGVKHKGHIAGLQQPEGEPLETTRTAAPACPQRPPVLQEKEIDGLLLMLEEHLFLLVLYNDPASRKCEEPFVADELQLSRRLECNPLWDGSTTPNRRLLRELLLSFRGLRFVSEAAIEAADVATTSGVTTGAPLDHKGVADPDTEMGAPTIHESASKAASEAADVAIVSEVTTGAPLGQQKVSQSQILKWVLLLSMNLLLKLATEAAYVVTSPEVYNWSSLDNQRVAEPDIKMGASPVNECAAKTATEAADVVTNLRVTTVASFVNRGVVEPDIKMEASPAKESAAEMDFVHPGFLATEAATHPGLPERVSLANEAVAEREVSEAGWLVSEPAAEAAGVVTVLEVTTGTPLDSEGTAEPETKIGPSFANESTAEMDSVLLGSLVTEATTHPGLIGRVSLVTETGVTGAATSTLKFPWNRKIQIENAGESVATEVQPSRDDGGDVVGSVNAMSTCPVTDKSPAFDEATPQDDAPSVSCVSGLVVRSVGKSGRTDVICYARRRGKRKLDMEETTTDQLEMGDGDIYGQCEEKATFDITVPYESAMSTAGSADIKLADIREKENYVNHEALDGINQTGNDRNLRILALSYGREQLRRSCQGFDIRGTLDPT
ncbi:Metal regulatory transcription factor 1 [Hordeum vulgare]|nr:Metal regulatory transcription factor 1 [Hordeum vulgare]